MSKILVAYFSATGKTAKVAEKLAEAIGADLYRIISAASLSFPDVSPEPFFGSLRFRFTAESE